MNKEKAKIEKQQQRKARVRAKVFGTAKKPRLSVNRSLKFVYVQLIDDENRKTVASIHQKSLKLKNKSKIELAFEVGKEIAKRALTPAKNKTSKKIKECVFDRGSYKYHGRVKAIAQGARDGGLKF